MNDVFELSDKLQQNPDALPYIIFATVIVVALFQHKRILALLDAWIDSFAAKKENAAVMAELVRNNTAALDNNTAALENNKLDREAVIDMMRNHEKMSEERDRHIQAVINRVDEKARSNGEALMLLEERTKK